MVELEGYAQGDVYTSTNFVLLSECTNYYFFFPTETEGMKA